MKKRLKQGTVILLGVILAGLLLFKLVGSSSLFNKDILSTSQIIKNIGSQTIKTRQTRQEKLTATYKKALKSDQYTSAKP